MAHDLRRGVVSHIRAWCIEQPTTSLPPVVRWALPVSARCQPTIAPGAKERVGWWQATYAPGALNSPRVSRRREPRGEQRDQSARPAECEKRAQQPPAPVRVQLAPRLQQQRAGSERVLAPPALSPRGSTATHGRHPAPRAERGGASGCARSGGATVACSKGWQHDAMRNIATRLQQAPCRGASDP